MPDHYDSLNKHIDDLLADRRPMIQLVDDEERALLEMAAQLRLLKPGADQPRVGFLQRIFRELGPRVEAPVRLLRRRVLIGSLSGVVAGLAAGLGLAEGARKGWLSAMLRLPNQTPLPGGWHAVAKLRDVPAGGALSFTIPSVSGYLLRNGDQISALSGICAHLGCAVDWDVPSREFICKCDSARFDRAGMFVSPTDSYAATVRPLSRMAVRVVDDTVFVRTA